MLFVNASHHFSGLFSVRMFGPRPRVTRIYVNWRATLLLRNYKCRRGRTHTDTYVRCPFQSASKLFILWIRTGSYFHLTPQCGSWVANVNGNVDWRVCACVCVCASDSSGVAQWGPNPRLLTVTTACLTASLLHIHTSPIPFSFSQVSFSFPFQIQKICAY